MRKACSGWRRRHIWLQTVGFWGRHPGLHLFLYPAPFFRYSPSMSRPHDGSSVGLPTPADAAHQSKLLTHLYGNNYKSLLTQPQPPQAILECQTSPRFVFFQLILESSLYWLHRANERFWSYLHTFLVKSLLSLLPLLTLGIWITHEPL